MKKCRVQNIKFHELQKIFNLIQFLLILLLSDCYLIESNVGVPTFPPQHGIDKFLCYHYVTTVF